MRLNEFEKIVGERCILVPYCRKHVQKYHEWMKDEELLAATCSEPLSLEEEFEMQQKWKDDADKLTFILLDKATFDETEGNELLAMAGDINAFICPPTEDQEIQNDKEEGNGNQSNVKQRGHCFELSLMIAEPAFRRRGLAQEACKLFIEYILHKIDPCAEFVAKIGAQNAASISLFENRLKFGRSEFSEIFQLHTMKLGNSRAMELVEGGKLMKIELYKE